MHPLGFGYARIITFTSLVHMQILTKKLAVQLHIIVHKHINYAQCISYAMLI